MTARNHYDLAQRNSSDRPLFAVTLPLTVLSGTTTTVIQDQIISVNTVPVLAAGSSIAAGIQASVYVSARDKGSITLTHSAPGGDAAFSLLLIG